MSTFKDTMPSSEDDDSAPTFANSDFDFNNQISLTMKNKKRKTFDLIPTDFSNENIFSKKTFRRSNLIMDDIEAYDCRKQIIVHNICKPRNSKIVCCENLNTSKNIKRKKKKKKQTVSNHAMRLYTDDYQIILVSCYFCNEQFNSRLYPYHMIKHFNSDKQSNGHSALFNRCVSCWEFLKYQHNDNSDKVDFNGLFCKQCSTKSCVLSKKEINSKTKSYFACSNCNKKFVSLYEFSFHLYEFHDESYCPFCFINFNLLDLALQESIQGSIHKDNRTSFNIYEHIQMHFLQSTLNCNLCKCSFIDEFELKNHQHYHHSISPNYNFRKRKLDSNYHDAAISTRDHSISTVFFQMDTSSPPLKFNKIEKIVIDKNATMSKLLGARLSLKNVNFSSDLVKYLNEKLNSLNKTDIQNQSFKNSCSLLNLKSYENLKMKCTECNDAILDDFHFLAKHVNIDAKYITKTYCSNNANNHFNSVVPKIKPLIFNLSFFEKPIPTPTEHHMMMAKKEDNEYDYHEEISQINKAIPLKTYEDYYLKMCSSCGKYLPNLESVSYHLQKNPTHSVIRRNVIYLYRIMDDIEDEETIITNSFKIDNTIYNDISIDQLLNED